MVKKLLSYAAVCLLPYAATAQTAALPLDSLRARVERTLDGKRYAEAAALLRQQAAAEPYRSAQASATYNLACALALAGQPQEALKALAAAQKLGWNQATLLRDDTDLTSLHELPEYKRLARRMAAVEARQVDPWNAQLVTSDIDLFWRAYDLAAQDTAHAEQIYQREYFDKGSVGLHDYFRYKIKTAKLFVKNQRAKAKYYRAIRPTTLRIATMTPQIRAGFVKLKELYPKARFPNVYFVIGRWNSGGTASGNGMLIGADQEVATATTPLGELNLWERNNIGKLSGLPVLVAHEHIHYIQKASNDPSLLHGAVLEGMADFIAELATGELFNARLHTYGRAHEKEIWADFSKEMGGSNWKNWIANSDQETADKPADLGYFVGYKICQSYYQEMADKKQAVHDILNITNYPAFLAKSRYSEKLAAR
jgi:hypothetical protein